MKNPIPKSIRREVAVVIGVFLLILMVQNRHPVSLRFFFWDFEITMLLLLPLVGLAGMIAGYALRGK